MHRMEPIGYHIRSRSCERCWKRSQYKGKRATLGPLIYASGTATAESRSQPAHAEDHHRQPQNFGHQRCLCARKEKHAMYYTITATLLALTVFTPTFIGLRARTNSSR